MKEEIKNNLSGPLLNMYFGSYEEDTDIAHIGRSKRDGAKVGSGRYPLGSGKEPYQHVEKSSDGAPNWFRKMYVTDKEGTKKLVNRVRSDSKYLKELDYEYNGNFLDYMFENVGNAESWLNMDWNAAKIKDKISEMNDTSKKAIKSKQISSKNMDELLDKQGDVISKNGNIKGLKDSSLNENLIEEFDKPQYEVMRSIPYENNLFDLKKSTIPFTKTYDDGYNDLQSVFVLKNGNKENYEKAVMKVADSMKKHGYKLVDKNPKPPEDSDAYHIYGTKNKELVQVFVDRYGKLNDKTDQLKSETLKNLNREVIGLKKNSKYINDYNQKHPNRKDNNEHFFIADQFNKQMMNAVQQHQQMVNNHHHQQMINQMHHHQQMINQMHHHF